MIEKRRKTAKKVKRDFESLIIFFCNLWYDVIVIKKIINKWKRRRGEVKKKITGSSDDDDQTGNESWKQRRDVIVVMHPHTLLRNVVLL